MNKFDAKKTYGFLTPIEIVERNKHGVNVWKCLCSCGRYKKITQTNLVQGNAKSCGCLRVMTSSIGALSLAKYSAGDRIHSLTVVEQIFKEIDGNGASYLLQCDCGNRIQRTAVEMSKNKTRSCTSCRSRKSAATKRKMNGQANSKNRKEERSCGQKLEEPREGR